MLWCCYALKQLLQLINVVCWYMYDQVFPGFGRSAARHSKGRATLLSTCWRTLAKMLLVHAVSSFSILVSSVQRSSANLVNWSGTLESIQVVLVNWIIVWIIIVNMQSHNLICSAKKCRSLAILCCSLSMCYLPRVGPEHPLSLLFLHFLVFCSFLLFPFLGGFFSIPFLSTTIVLLHFQAGGRRKRPNLGLVCCVYFVLSVFLS